MKITIEADTQETRIADLKRRLAHNQINRHLFKKAYGLLLQGKSLIYVVDMNNNYNVLRFRIK